ncbi:MAG: DUF4097 family beta strand repeat protein [Phycisphaerae bacterium]|nr:DUF4097 family beta strand repeat protein [Phycisphaerae bacterium]
MNGMLSYHRIVLLAALVLTGITGCPREPAAWISRQGHYEIEVETATKLVAATHNGHQNVTGVADHGNKVTVETDVRAGGADKADAQAALDAVVVTAERKGDEIQVSWDWKTPKKPAWRARVNYDIELPPAFNVRLHTHNGDVEVSGLTGDGVLTSHNGEITAKTSGARLEATTHNGSISVTTSATEVDLNTHNGRISARLEADGDVEGEICSHNGGIGVTLADSVAAKLDCSTSNGRIHCDSQLDEALIKKNSLTGSLRGGKKTLHIKTSNGSIKIE